jgi:hypothetical protein
MEMSRKSFLLALGTVLGLLGAAGATLALLFRHEPAFYLRCAVPSGEQRKQASDEFEAECVRLANGVWNKRQWDARFTEEQMNSYFEEGLLKEHHAERPMPEGVYSPRVSFETDKVRVGFRYGTGIGSTVISLEVRAWLIAREPNAVALEFQSIHAGALPISSQSILERFFEFARQRDIDPTWYRYNGHPVLLLRFQADPNRPTFQLQRLELRNGMLLIVGRSLDALPQADAATGTE